MKPVFVDDKEEFIEFINFMGDKTPLYRYSLPDFEFIGEYPALCPMRINLMQENGQRILLCDAAASTM